MNPGPNCPISGDPDTLQPKTGDYAEYDCPTCGRFRISRTALQLAGDDDQELLRTALEIAKHAADPDEVPTIRNLVGG